MHNTLENTLIINNFVVQYTRWVLFHVGLLLQTKCGLSNVWLTPFLHEIMIFSFQASLYEMKQQNWCEEWKIS